MILLIIFVALIFLLLLFIFIIKPFFMAQQHPFSQYHFQVQWGGNRMAFQEISGLDIEIETVHFREGSSPADSDRKLPGLRKFTNITLKRGLIQGDNQFFEWINTKQNGTIERRDLIIALLDEQHQPAIVWKVKNAFPVKYSGPVLKADSSEIAMESMEITHEGIEVEHN
jgi:phage tail-like protein